MSKSELAKSAQGAVEEAVEKTEEELKKEKRAALTRKAVRIVTVLFYLMGVSGPGTLLSLYYIIFWDPQIEVARPPQQLRSPESWDVSGRQRRAVVDVNKSPNNADTLLEDNTVDDAALENALARILSLRVNITEDFTGNESSDAIALSKLIVQSLRLNFEEDEEETADTKRLERNQHRIIEERDGLYFQKNKAVTLLQKIINLTSNAENKYLSQKSEARLDNPLNYEVTKSLSSKSSSRDYSSIFQYPRKLSRGTLESILQTDINLN